MIEMQRAAPARILKHRDVKAETVRNALAPLESVAPQPSANAANPATVVSCTQKQARLVTREDGATAVEVRCSCGEWTRVELQVGAAPVEAR